MQVLTCHVVLKPNFITTFDWLSSSAKFSVDHISITLFDCPDAIVAIETSDSCDNLLSRTLAKVDLLTVDAIGE